MSNVALRPLSLKQQKFIEAYLGECLGNATQAAKKAGYKGDDRAMAYVGCINLRKSSIIAAIKAKQAETHQKQALTIESVLRNLQLAIDDSVAHNDRPSLLRGLELQGKYLAMWTERSQVEDLTERRRLSDKAKEEATRLANIRLREVG